MATREATAAQVQQHLKQRRRKPHFCVYEPIIRIGGPQSSSKDALLQIKTKDPDSSPTPL